MKDVRYSRPEDNGSTHHSRSVRAKDHRLADNSVWIRVGDSEHVDVDKAGVSDPGRHVIRNDIATQRDEISGRIDPAGSAGRHDAIVRPDDEDQQPGVVSIDWETRGSTRPVRREGRVGGTQFQAREQRIFIDLASDGGVKDDDITPPKVMPIALDRRARRLRMQGLLEEAPALRRLVALDQLMDSQLAQ